MGVILDASLIIEAERGRVRMEPLLASLGDDPVAMTAITASELLHGCLRAKDAGVRARRFAFVDALLNVIPVIPFGLAEARRHAEMWAELMSKGRMIGAHDLLIAATVLARGDLLATLNQREFRRVAGLRLMKLDRFLA